MLIILGESSSGKTTLQRLLVENYPQYTRVVTYTTRPKREGEKNGIDYHFISQETFNTLIEHGFFIEYMQYKSWYYGIACADCKEKNNVAVVTPKGLRELKKKGIDTLSIYLKVDRRSRLIKCLSRGDDVDEAYRRNLSDVGQFDGIDDEVDYIIDNQSFHKNSNQILQCLNEILEKEKERKEYANKHDDIKEKK